MPSPHDIFAYATQVFLANGSDLNRAAQNLGISRDVLARLLAGGKVRAGTYALIEVSRRTAQAVMLSSTSAALSLSTMPVAGDLAL